MATLPRLPKQLRQALGSDAGDELVTILDEMRSEHAQQLAAIRTDFAEMRAEMRADIRRIEARLDAFDVRFEKIDGRFDKIDERFAALEGKVGDVKSDLMKWSFVFWCGAVTAVAALAGVLRS